MTDTIENTNEVFQQTTPQVKKQLSSMDIPVESVILPSKGLAYALDHPLSNEESVEIKCMTAREEDVLTSAALIRNGTVITQLLKSCLMDKTIDPDNLLIGDRNAILIAIRITGYGPEYTVKSSCPECNEQSDNDFTLQGLKIKPLGAIPVQENANLFEFTLPVSKKSVYFKLTTGTDENQISQIQERRKKLGSILDANVTTKLLSAIVAIDGDQSDEYIGKFVNNMRAGDSMALRKYMSKIEPGVEMKQWVSCSACQKESEVNIPLGVSFFWPDIS